MTDNTLKRISKLARQLPTAEQATLLAFAEFLHTRSALEAPPPPRLQPIPRPEQESVIAAIKRLSQTYPMLDKATLFNDTSQLMTQHVMQGRPAKEVIDDLEKLFQQHYAQLQHTDQ